MVRRDEDLEDLLLLHRDSQLFSRHLVSQRPQFGTGKLVYENLDCIDVVQFDRKHEWRVAARIESVLLTVESACRL